MYEVMAVALSRQFGEKEHGFIGLGTGDRAFILAVGIPTVAAELAISRGADFSLQYGTLFDPDVGGMPETLGDPDLLRWRCAARVPVERCLDVFRRGLMTCSFISGAQIDRFGNLNSVRIGRGSRPDVRLTGPIAQADHAVFAQRTFVILPHERRVFVERVDFVSAPGYGTGAGWREKLGLPGGGPAKVITDKAVLGFDPASKQMTLESVHPGTTVAEVLDATGFDLLVLDEVQETEPPSEDELALIRERIDPAGKLLQVRIR
ncbi:MAG TPA: CoA-transferase [Gaiellaceae bacterium]|nr:CoA-transferase [Gaiellaceae bacterium]